MNSGNYVLIGAGGTGSIIAPHLLRQLRKVHRDNFELHIVDGDVVSDGNIARQNYRHTDVGHNKAEILACQLADVTDMIDLPANICPEPAYIDQRTAELFIRDGDIVLIAVDNYRARADIERRALELDNVVVINAGNEATTSSCQIFARRNGENLTPPISYMHDEILTPGMTREEEDCMAKADSPDHEQTIAANLMSAAWMLAALTHVQDMEQRAATAAEIARKLGYKQDAEDFEQESSPFWHELHADLHKGKAGGPDWRNMKNDAWRNYAPTYPTHVELETKP